MRLSFLGNSYEAPTSPAPSSDSEQTATFLGRPYKVQQHTTSQRAESASLKYRGVDYSA